MSIKFTPYNEIIDNPEYLLIDIAPDNNGGHKMNMITHYTYYQVNDGWEKVLYYRFIGSNNDSTSPRNKLGGFVYVLTNNAYPNICKIGMTTGPPEKRLRQINNAGVVEDWELAFYKQTGRPYDFEQAIHLKLSEVRNRIDKEFFEIELNNAISLIEEMAPIFK